MAQRAVSIPANQDLHPYLFFDASPGHQELLLLREKINGHARLIERQSERNHFGNDEPNPGAQILRENPGGVQNSQSCIWRRVNDDNLETDILTLAKESVTPDVQCADFRRADALRSHTEEVMRGTLRKA